MSSGMQAAQQRYHCLSLLTPHTCIARVHNTFQSRLLRYFVVCNTLGHATLDASLQRALRLHAHVCTGCPAFVHSTLSNYMLELPALNLLMHSAGVQWIMGGGT